MGGQFGWGAVHEGWRKGPWAAQEDKLLVEHVQLHGEGSWNSVSKLTGLQRNGKSCRLRWVNYLRPDLKRGKITPQERSVIIQLHARWGNRWSAIARCLSGRTDNEIKNYWRTHFKKAKSSTNLGGEKKTRLLRQQQQRQQEQQQHQHHHEKPPQEQVLAGAENQAEMRKMAPQLEKEDGYYRVASLAQGMQGMSLMYPTPYEFQCDPSLMDDASSVDGVAWGCLWDVLDVGHTLLPPCCRTLAEPHTSTAGAIRPPSSW